MKRLGWLIETLPTAAARRRAATWIFQEYGQNSQKQPNDVAPRAAVTGKSVTAFVDEAAPELKSDRSLLLVAWSGMHGALNHLFVT